MSAANIPLEILRLVAPIPTWEKTLEEPTQAEIQEAQQITEALRKAGLISTSIMSEDQERAAIAAANKAIAQGKELDFETGQWVDRSKLRAKPQAPRIDGASTPNLSNLLGAIDDAFKSIVNPSGTRSPTSTRPLSPSGTANPRRPTIEIPPTRFASRPPVPTVIPPSSPTSTPPATIQQIRSTELPLGQLLQTPYTTQPYTLPTVEPGTFEQDFQEEQKSALDRFTNFLASAQPTSIGEGAVVTISPPQSAVDAKASGKATNIYGQTGISNLTQSYADRSKGALLPTIASIPIIPAIARVPQKKIVKTSAQALKNPSLMSKFNKKLDQVKGMLDLSKLIDLLNLAFSFHNATMLSTDILYSMSSIVDNVLTLFGLDTTGDNSVATFVSKKFNEMLNFVLGEQTVKDIKMKYAKVSAIYNSASNMLSLTQSMMSSTASILEVTGSYVGKIGNALKRVGAVQENAYGWMSEGLTARTARLQKLTGLLEGTQDVLSNLEMVTSDAVSIKDNIKELTEEKKNFDKAVEEGKAAFIPENKVIKAEAEKGKVADD